MSAKSLAFATTLAGLTLLYNAPAYAQSKAEIVEFDRLVSEAQAAYDAGEYARAIEAFKGAEKIYAHPKISARIVESHAHLGHCARAENRLARLQASAEAPEAGEALVATVEKCRPMGSIEVACRPATLVLELDSQPIACGESVATSAGEHQLVASAPGHETLNTAVQVAEATHTRVPVELNPTELAEPPGQSSLLPIVGWSGVGSGAALMVAALWVDSGSAGRQDEIRRASQAANFARARELNDDAAAKRTLTSGLFISGAVLAAGGAGVLIYDGFAEDSRDSSALAVRVSTYFDRVSVSIAW